MMGSMSELLLIFVVFIVALFVVAKEEVEEPANTSPISVKEHSTTDKDCVQYVHRDFDITVCRPRDSTKYQEIMQICMFQGKSYTYTQFTTIVGWCKQLLDYLYQPKTNKRIQYVKRIQRTTREDYKKRETTSSISSLWRLICTNIDNTH